MHFVAGNAGEFAAPKTGRRLHAVEFASRHANHPIAPESIVKKIRLATVNEILLFSMIRGAGLNHEALRQIASAGTKSSAMPVEIDLVRHVVESPDAMALPTCKARFRTFQICRISYGGSDPVVR